MKKRCCAANEPIGPGASAADEKGDGELATFAKAIAHPVRVRIVRILAQQPECICGDMVALLPVAQSTVSQHLKVLKAAGLIQGAEDGPRVRYCIERRALQRLKRLIQQL